MTHCVGMIVVLLAAPVGVTVVTLWQYSVAGRQVEDWAAANGWRIVRRTLCHFNDDHDPVWESGRGQVLYRVTVATSDGQEFGALVRVGGRFLGQLSRRVQVTWDDRL